MINKDEFKKQIIHYQDFYDRITKISDILKEDFFDSTICNYTYKLFISYLHCIFNDEAIEDIKWWLFERDYDAPHLWDSNHKVIPTNTLDDLWNIIKDNRI